MTRTFAPISRRHLEALITLALTEDDDDAGISHCLIRDVLGKDLKVEFDFENFHTVADAELVGLVGLHTLPNGLTFHGMHAGGDWEYPVYFIVYWDGKKLRGYVPMEGNPWNTTTKAAYGNDDAADLKNAKKRWPDAFKYDTEVEPGDFDFDPDKIKADIMKHLLPKS